MATIKKRIKVLIDGQLRQRPKVYSLDFLPSLYSAQMIDYIVATDGTPQPLEVVLAENNVQQGALCGAHGAYRTSIGPHGLTTAVVAGFDSSTHLQQANGSHQAKEVVIHLSALNSRIEPTGYAIDLRGPELDISSPAKNSSKPRSQVYPSPNDQYAHNASSLARVEIEQKAGEGLLTRDKQKPAPGSPLLH